MSVSSITKISKQEEFFTRRPSQTIDEINSAVDEHYGVKTLAQNYDQSRLTQIEQETPLKMLDSEQYELGEKFKQIQLNDMQRTAGKYSLLARKAMLNQFQQRKEKIFLGTAINKLEHTTLKVSTTTATVSTFSSSKEEEISPLVTTPSLQKPKVEPPRGEKRKSMSSAKLSLGDPIQHKRSSSQPSFPSPCLTKIIDGTSLRDRLKTGGVKIFSKEEIEEALKAERQKASQNEVLKIS